MKKYILFFSIPSILLIIILIVSIIEKNDIDSQEIDIKNLQEELISVHDKLEIEKLFSNDLNLANIELNELAVRGSKQTKFWDEFINKDLNLVIGHNAKSSSSVNTEVNKLLSYLRRNFDNRNIELGLTPRNEFFNTFSNPSEKQKFGFGFIMYDGFWPSFDKKEANTILIQAKIIKELCEFMLSSFDSEESFRLLSIKRESAGPEDLKHIGENQVKSGNLNLLRSSGIVSSYVFQISFTGKTRNCRTFINQLRSPYSLRLLKVFRQEEIENDSVNKTTAGNSENEETSILPIIRDITSVFTIELEYVYEVKSSLVDHITQKLNTDSNTEVVKDILSQFK